MTIAPIDLGDILLRPPTRADFAAIHALTVPEATREFLGQMPPSEADSFARLLRTVGCWTLYGYGTFMVVDKATATIIGNCGVFHSYRGHGPDFDDQPEAGWVIAQTHWGRGIAPRAMRAALDWFDRTHGAQRTTCMIEVGHAASDHIAGSLGFVPYRTIAPEPDKRALRLYERLPSSAASTPASPAR